MATGKGWCQSLKGRVTVGSHAIHPLLESGINCVMVLPRHRNERQQEKEGLVELLDRGHAAGCKSRCVCLVLSRQLEMEGTLYVGGREVAGENF